MEEDELWKVLWLSKTTGKMQSFIWTDFADDVMNQRTIFTNNNTDKTLTLYYEDIGHMITAPYVPE